MFKKEAILMMIIWCLFPLLLIGMILVMNKIMIIYIINPK